MNVVLDTNVVVSAILFPRGALRRFQGLWTRRVVIPLLSGATATELIRVLAYPKFRLDEDDIQSVLAAYVPFTETIDVDRPARPRRPACRDPHDQMFVELAYGGHADTLVSGDEDLLALVSKTPFAIESPADFLKRFA